MAALASVRRCADRPFAGGQRFDGRFANAGVLGVPFGRTSRGFGLHFDTNAQDHFAPPHWLAPLIVDGGRPVTTSSQAHRSADLYDPDIERRGDDPRIAHAKSKTASARLAAEFDHRRRGRGVRVASAEPGIIARRRGRQVSDHGRHALLDAAAKDRAETGPRPAPMKIVQQGTASSVWAAASAGRDVIGGPLLRELRGRAGRWSAQPVRRRRPALRARP